MHSLVSTGGATLLGDSSKSINLNPPHTATPLDFKFEI